MWGLIEGDRSGQPLRAVNIVLLLLSTGVVLSALEGRGRWKLTQEVNSTVCAMIYFAVTLEETRPQGNFSLA